MQKTQDKQNLIQRNYFDKVKNQYKPNLIENPPLHTQFEINAILSRLSELDINKNDFIIDFGSGNGRLTVPMLKNKYRVLAIDLSKKSLFNLLKTAENLNYNKLKIAQSLPNVSEEYKAIIGSDILHHINLDYNLPKFYKILKKGGKAIFSEPGALNPSWYIFLSFASNWKVEKGIIHCTMFNLKNKFIKHGFSKVNITGLGLFPRPIFNFSKKVSQFNDLIADWPFFKYFAYRYIIEAVK